MPGAVTEAGGERSGGRALGVLCALTSASMSALYVTLARGIMDAGYHPFAIGCLYCAGCSAFMYARAIAAGRGREITRAVTHHGRRIAVICCIGAMIQVLLLVGVALAGPVSQAILMRTDILFTIVIGWVFLRIGIGPWHLLAIAVMLCGAWRTVGLSADALRSAIESRAVAGHLLFLLAALGFATNGFLIKGLLRSVRREIVAALNVGGMSIAFLAGAFITGTQDEIGGLLTDSRHVLALALTIAAQTLLYSAYYKALSSLQVWMVRVFWLTTPMTACLLSYAILRRPPTGHEVQGMALVVTGGAIAVAKLHTAPEE